MFKRPIAWIVLIAFVTTCFAPSQSYASGPVVLPSPGSMVALSQSFEPVLIKGLTIHKDNPFMFDFIVDTGDSGLPVGNGRDHSLRQEADRLIKYFFASLTIPEKDLWVNLSPYEKDRIAPEALAQTALGRDLLAEDYILKQLTASLIYPEKGLGKEFWNKVYTKAQAQFGTTQIPVNTFNKVWILAEKATVYEHGQSAFVVQKHLKIMLEEDYLAMTKSATVSKQSTHQIASQIIREIVIPELEKEVNTGKNFATLRQIFNSLILASWYKKNLKKALLNQVYADKNTVKGVHLDDASFKEQIYQQYLQAYKKGVFNFIKEEPTKYGQTTPRKYFSGGFGVAKAMLSVDSSQSVATQFGTVGKLTTFSVLANVNDAMLSNQVPALGDLRTEKPSEISRSQLVQKLRELRKKLNRINTSTFNGKQAYKRIEQELEGTLVLLNVVMSNFTFTHRKKEMPFVGAPTEPLLKAHSAERLETGDKTTTPTGVRKGKKNRIFLGGALTEPLGSSNAAMRTIKVLFAGAPAGEDTMKAAQEALAAIQRANPTATIEVINQTNVGKDPQQLRQIIEQEKPAIILVRSETTAFSAKEGKKTPGFDHKEFMNFAYEHGLRAIVRMGVAYDNIDAAYAQEKGIAVVRTHGSANSVADVSLYLMSSLGNVSGFSMTPSTQPSTISWWDIAKTPLSEYERLKNNSKKWPERLQEAKKQQAIAQMDAILSVEGPRITALARVLNGKVIGLFGFGPIAVAVAEKLKDIKQRTDVDFKVVSYTRAFHEIGHPDHASRLELARTLGVTPVTREALFQQSNIVSFHFPEGKVPAVSAQELGHANIQAVINTSRTDIIAPEALRGFLANPQHAFLGDLDITSEHMALMQANPRQVVVLPHIAASTADAGNGVEENTVPAITEIASRLLGNEPSGSIDIVNDVSIQALSNAVMITNSQNEGLKDILVNNPRWTTTARQFNVWNERLGEQKIIRLSYVEYFKQFFDASPFNSFIWLSEELKKRYFPLAHGRQFDLDREWTRILRAIKSNSSDDVGLMFFNQFKDSKDFIDFLSVSNQRLSIDLCWKTVFDDIIARYSVLKGKTRKSQSEVRVLQRLEDLLVVIHATLNRWYGHEGEYTTHFFNKNSRESNMAMEANSAMSVTLTTGEEVDRQRADIIYWILKGIEDTDTLEQLYNAVHVPGRILNIQDPDARQLLEAEGLFNQTSGQLELTQETAQIIKASLRFTGLIYNVQPAYTGQIHRNIFSPSYPSQRQRITRMRPEKIYSVFDYIGGEIILEFKKVAFLLSKDEGGFFIRPIGGRAEKSYFLVLEGDRIASRIATAEHGLLCDISIISNHVVLRRSSYTGSIGLTYMIPDKAMADSSVGVPKESLNRAMNAQDMMRIRPGYIQTVYQIPSQGTDRAGQEGKATLRIFEIFDLKLTPEEERHVIAQIKNDPDKYVILLKKEVIEKAKNNSVKVVLQEDMGIIPKNFIGQEVTIGDNSPFILDESFSTTPDDLSTDAQIRLSPAGLYRIKVGDYYLLSFNKNRLKKGRLQITPIGGAYDFASAEGKAIYANSGIQMIPENPGNPLEMRQTIPSKSVGEFVRLFKEGQGRELSPIRELLEELVGESSEEAVFNELPQNARLMSYQFAMYQTPDELFSAVTTLIKRKAQQKGIEFNLELLTKAYELASLHHKGVLRDDGRPYIFHPLEIVYYMVNSLDILDQEALIAALVHDLPEDTTVTLDQITELFGKNVADPVGDLKENTSFRQDTALTYKAANGINYSGRLASKFEHLDRVTKNNRPVSIIIKGIDRLHNLLTNESLQNTHERRMEIPEIDRWQSFLEQPSMPEILRNEIKVFLTRERKNIEQGNPAMETPGGIDLNTNNMAMTIQKDANGGVKVNFDPAMIERIKKEGIQSMVPIIIQVTPIADFRPLLGLSPASKDQEIG